jgi:hypothetical protein
MKVEKNQHPSIFLATYHKSLIFQILFIFDNWTNLGHFSSEKSFVQVGQKPYFPGKNLTKIFPIKKAHALTYIINSNETNVFPPPPPQ